MRILIALSWIAQVILAFLALGSLIYGDPTKTPILSQGTRDAIIYMFLFIVIAGVTYIYENNKKRVAES